MSAENSLFIIYETEAGIELRVSCYDYPDVRVLCTCRSQEVAQKVAQRVASMRGLPFVDHVQSSDLSNDSE